MVRGLRRRRHQAAARRPGRIAGAWRRGRRSCSSRCCSTTRSSRSRRSLVDVPDRDLLRQRRRRRGAGAGHAVLARPHSSRGTRWSTLWGGADRGGGDHAAAGGRPGRPCRRFTIIAASPFVLVLIGLRVQLLQSAAHRSRARSRAKARRGGDSGADRPPAEPGHRRWQLIASREETSWIDRNTSAFTGCSTRSRSSTGCANSGEPAWIRPRRAAALDRVDTQDRHLRPGRRPRPALRARRRRPRRSGHLDEGNVLTIFGERTGAPEVEDKAYYVRERQYGGFRRTINLPEETDRSSVTALLQDGLLEIKVVGGCAARREPERIDISVGGGDRK